MEQRRRQPDARRFGTEHGVDIGHRPVAGCQRLGHDGVEGHAGNLGRVLHHEVQPGGGALPHRHVQDVDPGPPGVARTHVQGDRAGEDFVAGLAHDRPGQRALARPVGTHHGMHLPTRHGQVDAAQDLGSAGSDAQAADLQGRRHPTTP